MIPIFDISDAQADISNALRRDGCVVVKGVSAVETRDALVAELTAYLEKAEVESQVDPEAFYPGSTKRVTALVARSEACHELLMHPTLHSVVDDVLLPNCAHYQLHVATALVVGPGARKQVLHREDDVYEFFEVPRPDMIVASMWAMTDFTKANGATQIVPGSHQWEAGRVAAPDEILQAEMSAGDVLMWHGGTLHGAGANISEEWRYGVFLSFSLGWLRQEENQYLDVPPGVAERLPKAIRDLVGYKMHDGLGFYDPSVRQPNEFK
jgi:ectoine hydroxylase-related dioxygenase (phytanoyl-CoA dioxygenase family)